MVSREESPLASRALARLGTMLLGRYRLVRLVGIGGMGAVYAGVHRNGHAVAVKILHDRLSNDPEIERLFRREAHLANNVNHPGVVPVIDDDVAEDGCVFLVMPLLDGDTLRGRWERHERRLPLDEVVVVAHAVLEVLQAAHAKKIVHRDIKPDNIFIERSGAVRVLDFGIARFFETNDPASATRSGRAIGTPAFMAPEQALGRLREVDGRTDIWALGATIFATLSGQFVHEAETGSEVIIHAATRPARPLSAAVPDVPAVIAAVVDRALAFERSERWPDAAAMDRALLAAYEEAFARPITAIAPLASAPSPITGTDVHSALTQAPVVATAPEQVTRATDPGAAASANADDGQLRLADAQSQGTPAGKPTRRALFPRHWFAIALAMASLSGVGWVWKRQHAPSPTAAASATASAEDASKRSLDYYNAAVQAARNAETFVVSVDLDRATAADPSFARAHLLRVLLSGRLTNAVRVHYSAAIEFRHLLNDDERPVLDALAPAMGFPPDQASTLERLKAIHPANAWVSVAIQRFSIHLLRYDDAIHYGKLALESDPQLTIAQLYIAKAFLAQSLREEAYRALQECTRMSPRATVCLDMMNDVDAIEGRCERLMDSSRALLAIAPDKPPAYLDLARGIFATSGDLSSAIAMVDEGVSKTPEPIRGGYRAQFAFEQAVLSGNLQGALEQIDTWEQMPNTTEGEEEEHSWRMGQCVRLALDVDQPARAKACAETFLKKRAAWPSDPDVDLDIGATGALYQAGFMSREEFLQRRNEWLTRQAHSSASMRKWILGFAETAKTFEDATDAMRAVAPLGKPHTVPPHETQNRFYIGRLLMLSKRTEEAIPFLRAAVQSCEALFVPVEHTLAAAYLGEALMRTGDSMGACAAFRVVIARWGQSTMSRSARVARERFASLGCTNPTSTIFRDSAP